LISNRNLKAARDGFNKVLLKLVKLKIKLTGEVEEGRKVKVSRREPRQEGMK